MPSWNSRVADRDGHRGLHSEVYIYRDVHANSTPNLIAFRYVIEVAASGLLPVLDPEPAALAFGAGGGWD